MSGFTVDLKALKRREKSSGAADLARAEVAGEAQGFVDRAPKGRRGRAKSPRTGQVHAKVLPGIEDEIAAEARRRGVTQGVLVEEAWALYKRERGI